MSMEIKSGVKTVTITDDIKLDRGKYFIDENDDGVWQEGEMHFTEQELKILLRYADNGADLTMEQLIDKVSEGIKYADLEKSDKSEKIMKEIKDRLDDIDKQIDRIDKAMKKMPEEQKEILAKIRSALVDEKEQILEQLRNAKVVGDEAKAMKREALGLAEKKADTEATPKGTSDPTPSKGAGQKAATEGAVAQPGFKAGYQYGGGGANGFDDFLMNFINSSHIDQNIMNTWGEMGKQGQQNSKMMLLFFAILMRSLSGDPGDQMRLMSFLYAIICKNRSIHNAHYAVKLIELDYEQSAMMEEFTNTKTPDGSDFAAQHNFTKSLEQLQAFQRTAGTAQKLITQLMEDGMDTIQSMAQLFESWKNLNQKLTDIQGR